MLTKIFIQPFVMSVTKFKIRKEAIFKFQVYAEKNNFFCIGNGRTKEEETFLGNIGWNKW